MKTELTAPYINMNGNTKESMIEELYDVVHSLDDAINKVTRCEYSDGRNSKDMNHSVQMREDRKKVLNQLIELRSSFNELLEKVAFS